jgi:predicted nucleotidyltransferase
MRSHEVIQKINKCFYDSFDDYKGLYFYGSRLKNDFKPDSDYDMVLLYDKLDYEKELRIAGLISQIEYENSIFIDYKTFTIAGDKSIENIRNKINPVFISEAIDHGIFYGRP